MINELKQIDKNDLFKPIKKEKLSFYKKVLKIFGYGKKR